MNGHPLECPGGAVAGDRALVAVHTAIVAHLQEQGSIAESCTGLHTLAAGNAERFVDDPKKDNEHPKDKYLPQKLRDEAPGILAWLVRGCLAWQRNGLNAPLSVTAATDSYRREEDILGHFLTECTVQKQGATTRAIDLYRAYVAWCDENGITPRSNTVFGKKVKRFYLTVSRTNRGRCYNDIGLLTDIQE